MRSVEATHQIILRRRWCVLVVVLLGLWCGSKNVHVIQRPENFCYPDWFIGGN